MVSVQVAEDREAGEQFSTSLALQGPLDRGIVGAQDRVEVITERVEEVELEGWEVTERPPREALGAQESYRLLREDPSLTLPGVVAVLADSLSE